MDAQLPRSSNEKVELAILWFLDQFRKTYVGDQLQRTSKVSVSLTQFNFIQKSLLLLDMCVVGRIDPEPKSLRVLFH